MVEELKQRAEVDRQGEVGEKYARGRSQAVSFFLISDPKRSLL